jgi:hypothetical protein
MSKNEGRHYGACLTSTPSYQPSSPLLSVPIPPHVHGPGEGIGCRGEEQRTMTRWQPVLPTLLSRKPMGRWAGPLEENKARYAYWHTQQRVVLALG